MSTVPDVTQDWPADEVESVPLCPVCGSAGRIEAHVGCRDVVFGAAPGTWTVKRCSDCGSGYLDPRPNAASIGKAYSIYYTHASRLPDPPARRKLKHRLLDRVRGSYINRHYGRGVPSLGAPGLWLLPAFGGMRETLDRQHRWVPFPKQGPARLLDMGCGNGDFLKIAGAAGWETYGCDPDPAALVVARAHCANLRPGGIEAWQDQAGFFNAITMNHVIEHLHDPVEVLRHCHAMLAENGILQLETPNFDALGREIYQQHWRGLEVPRHLVLFTWQSLIDTLERTGFRLRRRIMRENFWKQSQRSAKIEAGYFDYQTPEDISALRMPSPEQRDASARDWRRSEWISLVAEKL